MKNKKKPIQIIISIIFIIFLGIAMVFGLKMSDSLESANSSSSYVMAMDTVMSITVYGRNKKVRQRALDAAQAELERLDTMFSVGNSNGEVYRLNHGEEITNPPNDLTYILERSYDIAQSTDGAFDFTIYPLMELWGFTGDSPKVPMASDIEATLSHTGYENITFDSNAIFLPDGFAVDFGAIVKGYASKRVADVILDSGIESALINLGGNIYVIGDNPNGRDWNVAIDDPFSDGIVGTVSISNKCVITSGSYQRYFEENGEKYHHIIDPGTGFPADSGLASVTVIGDDPTRADALSTALFVMGYEKALSYWTEHSDEFDLVLVTNDGEVLATSPSFSEKISPE